MFYRSPTLPPPTQTVTPMMIPSTSSKYSPLASDDVKARLHKFQNSPSPWTHQPANPQLRQVSRHPPKSVPHARCHNTVISPTQRINASSRSYRLGYWKGSYP